MRHPKQTDLYLQRNNYWIFNVMQNLILHFGEYQDQKNIYNLIVKMTDVPTDQLEPFRDHLQSKDIEIDAIARNSIEAKFAGEYLTVTDMIGESDQEGWIWKEETKILSDKPR